MLYIHFTSRKDAEEIVRHRKLLACSYLERGVFAAPVGGKYVPGVQRTSTGRPKNRDFAVFFDCKEEPDGLFIEEAMWRLDSVNLLSGMVITAEEAITMLDDSLPRDRFGMVTI